MIRATTPLPKPPSAEKDLLDIVLRLSAQTAVVYPRTSSEIVGLVQHNCRLQNLPRPCAVDIRLMIRWPYFDLTDRGWLCRWRLPLPTHEPTSKTGDTVGARRDSQPPGNGCHLP